MFQTPDFSSPNSHAHAPAISSNCARKKLSMCHGAAVPQQAAESGANPAQEQDLTTKREGLKIGGRRLSKLALGLGQVANR